MVIKEIKEINVCFDSQGKVKCATSYNEWCETCPNFKHSEKKYLITEFWHGASNTNE